MGGSGAVHLAARPAVRLVAVLTASVLLGLAPAAPAATTSPTEAGVDGRSIDVRLRDAVRRLSAATETRAGYDRDKFRHWVDENGDCQDTRDEVLAAESRVAVSGCDISTGRWRSYYDGLTWASSGDVDIDHLVPLAEAWDSGARRWNADTRERFANDLADRRALVAVTDNVNQSKGDQDIAEWRPERARCRYLAEWVAVKTRWSLRVDRTEKRSLRRLADGCRNVVLHVRRARIALGGDGGGGTGDPQPEGRMRISRVVYDPAGTDTENGETITLVNRGRRAQLQGFVLRDEAGASYRLPGYRIGSDGSVTVHSGHGSDRRGHLYAGWGFTWNNDGDTARLLDPDGDVVDSCSWGDGSGTASC
jgi:hypothetical protein